MQSEIDAVAQQRPRSPYDDGRNDEADNGIDPQKARQHHRETSEHNAERYRGICRHVQECSTDVDILAPAREEHEGRRSIDDDADRSHDHDGLTCRYFGMAEALDRLPGDGSD